MLKTLATEELKILNALADNGLMSNAELATLLKLDAAQVAGIRKELESAGIILKYRAIINWKKSKAAALTR